MGLRVLERQCAASSRKRNHEQRAGRGTDDGNDPNQREWKVRRWPLLTGGEVPSLTLHRAEARPRESDGEVASPHHLTLEGSRTGQASAHDARFGKRIYIGAPRPAVYPFHLVFWGLRGRKVRIAGDSKPDFSPVAFLGPRFGESRFLMAGSRWRHRPQSQILEKEIAACLPNEFETSRFAST